MSSDSPWDPGNGSHTNQDDDDDIDFGTISLEAPDEASTKPVKLDKNGKPHGGGVVVKDSPEDVARKLRTQRIVEMRVSGKSYEIIAHELGMTAKKVEQAMRDITQKMTKRTLQSVADYRALQNERLDRLLTGIWPNAMKGRAFAVDRALAIIDMQNKLYGLYMPTRFTSLHANLSGPSLDKAIDMALSRLAEHREGRILDVTPDSAINLLESGMEGMAGGFETDVSGTPGDADDSEG